jgi:tRNA (guanosine-2'-O-)-methyltransferase
LGNEAKGVSNSLLNLADAKIYIPMKGSVQSLNVSVAAGIILFQV